MTLIEKIKAIILIPNSFRHLVRVMSQLKNQSYLDLIVKQLSTPSRDYGVEITVKSYFWAARAIPNCKCLPRSIAIYQKLKAQGYDAKHKFGVLKSNPKNLFAAHAWVELDGVALNETKNLNQFIELEKPNESNPAKKF